MRLCVRLLVLVASLPMVCAFHAIGQQVPAGIVPTQQHSSPRKAAVAVAYGKLPLSFEASEGSGNPGQGGGTVRYTARGQGYGLFLMDKGAVLTLSQREKADSGAPATRTDTIMMGLAGSNPKASVTGRDQLPGTVNYIVGSDQAKWRTGVPTFAKVSYEGVYPGVDLVYYGNQRQLEYDFVVAPGADSGAIRLQFSGAKQLRIDAGGELRIEGGHGSIDFHKPVVYQQEGGQRREVEGEFRLLANNTVAFRLGSYDHAKSLVIDPVLEYSTYLGGTNGGNFGGDFVAGIAIDKSGNAYVTGQADSTNFPTTSGAYQTTNTTGGQKIFVTKINATGNALLYSTYIGGTYGGDIGSAIAINNAGFAYITGQANSPDFPVTINAFQGTKPGRNNAFVAELNSDGSGLIYSTFLGGSYVDSGSAIALDTSGDVYVAGTTGSSNFPVTTGAYQTVNHAGAAGSGFVTKLNAGGTGEVYSTLIGGSGGDAIESLAVSTSGDAYVTGYAHSSDFPTTAGVFQPGAGFQAGYGDTNAFVAAFNSTGTGLLYSTYLGGSSNDRGYGIAVDSSGRAYVTGSAYSANFPVTPGAYETVRDSAPIGYPFVTKFNAAGTGLIYSTFLGDSATGLGGGDYGSSILVDSAGDVYVTGTEESRSFPVTANGYQTTDPGDLNAFVSELNESGTGLVYSTYLGGSNYDYGKGIALDTSGGIYVAGQTFSTDFPTVSAYQASDPVGTTGDSSGFVAKLDAGGVPAILTSPGLGTVLPNSVTFNWTAGSNVTAYQLWLGTTAGASNLYNSHGTTAHTETVTNIPMNGGTVFVTLFSQIGGVYTGNPYTYIAMGTPAKAVLTTPTPGTTLTGSSVTFAWTAGTGVTAYQLWLGSKPGANDLYNSGGTAALTKTVTGLPTNGGTIFATLYSLIDSGYTANSYTYIAAGTPRSAVLSTPSPGSTLSGTSTTFYWTAGTGVTNYQLWLGTTAGANNLYNSRGTYSTSAAVTGLPASGGTIFATLFSLIDGNYQSNAYTYIASGIAVPAVLTTPTPGSVLPGASVTFNWNTGTGVTAYQFWLGTTAGASNLYNSHGTNALTATVTGLPLNSGTIYATLFSLIDGAYKSNAYVYTASSGIPIESVLYSFTGNQANNVSTDAYYPEGNLVMDSSGNIYGTTMYGGTGNAGTVFKLTPSGTEAVLHSFQNNGTDGFYPYGGVVLDKQGNLYGTTHSGGNGTYGETPGTVFKLTPQGAETILYNFGSYSGDGMYPDAGLIFDDQGNLYGTTSAGGTSGDGTVFKITPAGNEVVLHTFSGPDGQMPLYGNLVMDAGGNLYGTTYAGGAYGYGTVFKLAPSGTETVLHNFNNDGTDGDYPTGGLILDLQGNLYGTTYNGGSNGAGGVVYKVTPGAAEAILYSFNLQGVNGFYDSERSLVFDKQGNLYGTTTGEEGYESGNVFELMPSGVVTVLHSFAAYATDGSLPTSGLIFDAKGNLYGVTENGGTTNGGTVYEITPVS